MAAIRELTTLDLPQLEGCTLTEFVLGSTPDILAYTMFDWYQWYHEPEAQFPYEKKVMGQWVGTANSCTDLSNGLNKYTPFREGHHTEVRVGCNGRGVVDLCH